MQILYRFPSSPEQKKTQTKYIQNSIAEYRLHRLWLGACTMAKGEILAGVLFLRLHTDATFLTTKNMGCKITGVAQTFIIRLRCGQGRIWIPISTIKVHLQVTCLLIQWNTEVKSHFKSKRRTKQNLIQTPDWENNFSFLAHLQSFHWIWI